MALLSRTHRPRWLPLTLMVLAGSVAGGAVAQTPVPLDIAAQYPLGQTRNIALSGAGPSVAFSLGPVASLTGWAASGALLKPLSNLGLAGVGNWVYAIGGNTGVGANAVLSADVARATVAADGTLGAFTLMTNALPKTRAYATVVAYGNVLYVIGGHEESIGPGLTDSVLYSKVGADGQPGPWREATKLPAKRDTVAAYASHGNLVVLAGADEAVAGTSTVWVAPIRADGNLGAWKVATDTDPTPAPLNMNAARYAAAALGLDSRAWVAGGAVFLGSSEGVLNDVMVGVVNPMGLSASWSQSSPLPTGKGYLNNSSPFAQGRWYLVAGQETNNLPASTVFSSEIGVTGTPVVPDLKTWAQDKALPIPLNQLATTAAGVAGRPDGSVVAGSLLVAAGGYDDALQDRNNVYVGTLAPDAPATTAPYGVYESPMIDLGADQSVQRFDFTVVPATGGTATVQYRLAGGGGGFSDWSAPLSSGPILINKLGRTFQYRIVLTAGPTGASPSVSGLSLTSAAQTLTYGDLNGDNQVNVLDGVLALKIAAKIVKPNERQTYVGDVAPKPGKFGLAFGDGALNVADAIRILRAAAKLEQLP